MMKSKFMAGTVATLITLVVVVGAAILLTSLDYERTGGSDRVLKFIAFAAIAIWLGLFAWLKPKDPAANQNNPTHSNGEVKQEIKPRETKRDERNSYR